MVERDSIGGPPAAVRRVTALFIVGLVGVVGSPTLVVGLEDPGVQFLDNRPLALTEERDAMPIDVINGGSTAASLTLSVVGVALPEGATTLPVLLDDDASLTTTSTSIDAGELWTVDLAVDLERAHAGSYSGVLVVHSSDGSLDRRELTVEIAAPEVPPPSEAPGVLRLPLPQSIVVDGVLDLETQAAAATISVGEELADTLSLAPLTDAEGDVATMALDEQALVLSAQSSGAYQGRLAREPVDDEKEPVELSSITFNVRDALSRPFGVILLALLAAFLIEHLATSVLPKASLKQRLKQLDADGEKARKNHQDWLDLPATDRHWPGPANPIAPRITRLQDENERRLMETATGDALRSFDDLPDLEARLKKWGGDGEEYRKVVNYLGTYRDHLEVRRKAVADWRALVRELTSAEVEVLEKSGFRREFREGLAGGPLSTAGELEAASTSLQTTLKKLTRVQRLERALKQMGAMTADHGLLPEREKVAELRAQLLLLHQGDLGDVDTLEKEVRLQFKTIIERIIAPMPAGPDRRTVVVDQESVRSLWFEDRVGESAPLVVVVERKPEVAGPVSPPLEPIAASPANLRRVRVAWSFLFGSLVTAATVVVALSAQYWAKPAFGSVADYWALVAWALATFTAAQLLKHGAALVGPLRLGPR